MRRTVLTFSIIAITIVMMACKGNRVEEVVLKYYEDGTPQDVMVYKITNGDSIPMIERKFHANGVKFIEGYFKDGKRDSIWTSWYPNNLVWSQTLYVNGMEEGEYKTFHDNGLPYINGFHHNGKETGVWNFYSPNGELLKTYNFDTNETITE